jgi:hypothetical protein
MNNNIKLIDYSISRTTEVNSSIRNNSDLKNHSKIPSNKKVFSNIDSCEKNSYTSNGLKTNNHNTYNNINSSKKISKIDSFFNKLNDLRALQEYGLFTNCMIETNNNFIDIDYKNDSYKLSNYYRCKNRFCVYCSSKHNFVKRKPLEELIKLHQDSNKSILLITFNLPNYKNQQLEYLLEILNKSFSSMLKDSIFNYSQTKLISKKARNSESLKDYIDLNGIYSTNELTNSLKFGWNVHKHSLFFSNKKLNDSQIKFIKSQLIQIFKKYAYKHYSKHYKKQSNIISSKHVKNYCIDVQNITNNHNQVSFYLNKNHDISHELNPNHKETKSAYSYSLNDLYSMLIKKQFDVISKEQTIALIHNILDVFKGKEISQYRLLKDEYKAIVEASKEELKQSQKEYMNNLYSSKNLELTQVEFYNKKVIDVIKNNLDIKTSILKPYTSHVRRVKTNSSTNRYLIKKSLNRRVISLNKAIVLNGLNKNINKINKLASNTVITSNRGTFIMNSS